MIKPKTKTDALLDDLLKDYESPEDILGEHGLLSGLTKRLVERARLNQSWSRNGNDDLRGVDDKVLTLYAHGLTT